MKMGIVACVHGNERYGAEVLRGLRGVPGLDLIFANRKAYERNVRFIDEDLNRCFPGKRAGTIEQRIAFRLVHRMHQCETVIDLHSTSTPTPPFIILTGESRQHHDLVRRIPIRRVVLMSRKVANGGALIDHCRAGVSLEMGQHDDPSLVKRTIEIVKQVVQGGKKVPQTHYRVVSAEMHKDKPKEVRGSFIEEEDFVPILVTPQSAGEIAYLKAIRDRMILRK